VRKKYAQKNIGIKFSGLDWRGRLGVNEQIKGREVTVKGRYFLKKQNEELEWVEDAFF
jgi:hypothetical protein